MVGNLRRDSHHHLCANITMVPWTHLIRFVAIEDHQIHLGQLVDTSRDVGQDSVNGKDIAAYLIDGNVFDGRVTDQIYHVKQVSEPHQGRHRNMRKGSKSIDPIDSLSSSCCHRYRVNNVTTFVV